MLLKKQFKHTLIACYIGYITQAIVVNFAPLLFLTFQKTYSISIEKITLLITLNFVTQIIVDIIAVKFIEKTGYRIPAILAHVFASLGLFGMGILPKLLPDPFAGLLIAMVLYSIGGGLIEVLISPIVEACPTEKKAANMSFLHSFYSWGQAGVISLSTLFFIIAGTKNWVILSFLWALIPLFNAIYFTIVPVPKMIESHERLSYKKMLSNRIFWLFIVLMFAAGASELAMSQWASAFAEAGLKVSKTVGDIAGPCFFAILMGIARVFYSKMSEKINLYYMMFLSGVLCIFSYLLAVFAPIPALSLIGCAVCGLSVGILWPGTLSLAAAKHKNGGTAMFGVLALAGDSGCVIGPTLVGFVSGRVGDNLKTGLLLAIIFPVILILTIFRIKKLKSDQSI